MMAVKYTPREIRSNKKLDSWTESDTDDDEETEETEKELVEDAVKDVIEKEVVEEEIKKLLNYKLVKHKDGDVVLKGRVLKGVKHDGNTDKK